MSDEELNSLDLENKTFGVIGVCGVVGNLVARILMDHGFAVVGTDISSKEDCRFYSSFKDYDIEIFFGGHPDEFFSKIDYIVPPPSMGENAKVLQIANSKGIKIIHLGDIFKLFKPEKEVICISGTNGKTTTTTLLKHIAYANGIKPSEHNLAGMQGNNEFIPSLQTRLNGDVAILETGTDGTPGGLKSIIDLTHPTCGILTNITIDHLVDPDKDSSMGSALDSVDSSDENSHPDKGFLEYARVKGELIQGIEENNGTLIYNIDDPTIVGLLRELDYKGESISFGLENPNNADSTDLATDSNQKARKPCWCGRDILIDEIISGCGTYDCECGISYEKPDYYAKDISLKERTFTLETPEGEYDFKLTIDGLHNVYNALGVIISAHKFLNLSYEDIADALLTFTGVSGRMDLVSKINGRTIMVDYAHNPAGVKTILKEITKIYGDATVVITVSSESGFEGDIDILDSAIGNVKYIVPASHDSRYAVDRLLELTREGKQDELDLSKEHAIADLEDIFVFTDETPEQKSKRTLGASDEQVINGLKTALKTESNIILLIGEAAFKFKSSIEDFCNNY